MSRPWRLLLTRWPWRSVRYLTAQLFAGWIAWFAMSTVILLPVWAKVWAHTERRLLPLMGRDRLKDPAGEPGVLWREIGHSLLTACAGLAGTGLLAALAIGARSTLFAPIPGLPNPLGLGYLQDSARGPHIISVAVGLALAPFVLWALTGLALAYSQISASVLSPPTAMLKAQLASMADASVAAQDQLLLERRLLQQQLHDGAQLHITVAGVRLGLVEYEMSRQPQHDDELLNAVRQARDHVDEAMDQIRTTAQGLMPRVLVEQGICPALHDLVADLPVPVEVRCAVRRMPEGLETDLYLIASEALTNVVKHAHAQTALVHLTRTDDAVVMSISDDGRGDATMSGSGLLSIAARARRRGGVAQLSSPAGGPTVLTIRLPTAGHR